MTVALLEQSKWIESTWWNCWPVRESLTLWQWAEKHVKLVGSARSEKFSVDISPWIKEPMESVTDDTTSIETLVKPVQAAGSVAGEAALCYWIAVLSGGDIMCNWEDDDKALQRWDKRTEKILKACLPVMAKWPNARGKVKRGQVIFPHMNLIQQGAWSSSNLDSDSIRFLINEEIHNWKPGHLQKAYNRTTAFWNKKIINISNGGYVNDQLHQAFLEGSQQQWENPCPFCGHHQVLHFDWKANEQGGLRWDTVNTQYPDGGYNYNKLEGTIYYECEECGGQIKEEHRKKMSISGRYSEPKNSGARINNRSHTLEAVAVDYIPWITLVQEYHSALRAMKYGDIAPYIRFVTERKTKFWDPEDRPFAGKIEITENIQKSHEGLEDRDFRFMTVDKQGGRAAVGDVPHYWIVIRDWKENVDSRLVWEGRVNTDEEIEELREEYEIEPRYVLVDSGYKATEVYQLCARYGYAAIKGEDRIYYPHDIDGIKMRKIFSPIQYVDPFAGTSSQNRQTVPLILYSKQGIRDRLDFIRASEEVKWEVPGDVSDDYKSHMVAEELKEHHHPRTGQSFYVWVQVKRRNDLFVCECYQALLAEMAGIVKDASVMERPDDVSINTK